MKRSVISFLIILIVGALVLIVILASLQRMHEEVAPMDVSSGFKFAFSLVGATAVLETVGITLYFLGVILLNLRKERSLSSFSGNRSAYRSTSPVNRPGLPRQL